MEIVNYFESNDQPALMEKISRCDWSAARFLVELLSKGTFYEMLGGWGEVYLLMDGNALVSFITFTGQDAVRDEALTPWIGFVFTAPEYRGHRYAGVLLKHAEDRAAQLGYPGIYVGTDAVGLYEKYGYVYRENRIDYWGGDMRVLYREVRAAENASL